MSVFFTDSNCEIWFKKAEELNIKFISMPYAIDGVESGYDLGKTHDYKAFFNKIKEGKNATTMALNPDDYYNIFEPYLKKGEDVLYVHFSSNLSGTFEFLEKAKKELLKKYPNRKIKTVDTLNISLGAGVIVYKAAQLHNSGASDEEVIEYVKKLRNEIATYFTVDDLHHLKRGGRISSTQAVIGTMLGIKPILYVNGEGKLVSESKVSGRKKALLELIERFKTNGENVADYPIAILHADCESDANFLKQKVVELAGNDADVWVQQIGPTVGTHCGPGTVGIVFHKK
jgi:DegV family protein with EDD domain